MKQIGAIGRIRASGLWFGRACWIRIADNSLAIFDAGTKIGRSGYFCQSLVRLAVLD